MRYRQRLQLVPQSWIVSDPLVDAVSSAKTVFSKLVVDHRLGPGIDHAVDLGRANVGRLGDRAQGLAGRYAAQWLQKLALVGNSRPSNDERCEGDRCAMRAGARAGLDSTPAVTSSQDCVNTLPSLTEQVTPLTSIAPTSTV